MFHLTCFSRGTQLEALEQQERAVKALTAAMENVTRAARLVEQGARVRRARACAVCGRRLRADEVAWAPAGTPVHVTCPAPASRHDGTPA
jgi:hypothetical protein